MFSALFMIYRKSISNGVQTKRNFLWIFSGPEDTRRKIAADWPVVGSFPVSGLVALAALLAALFALSRLRDRFMMVDRIYLSVFG
jgi:hypothetical protein